MLAYQIINFRHLILVDNNWYQICIVQQMATNENDESKGKPSAPRDEEDY